MSSYWSDAPYRQRAKPVLPPTVKAPMLGPVGNAPGGNPFASVGTPGGSGAALGNLPNIPGISPTVLGQAYGVIDPQLQNAADIINRRSQMGSGAISGLTNFLAQEMGGISGMVGNAYGGPIKLAKKVAGWAGSSLTGAGQESAGNVGRQMAVGNAGPIAQSSDLNLAQEGKGAGGAAYGTGIAELDNLIASRAAAQTRAALEPTFATMTGQQQQGMLGAQLARQLADQQGTIMASLPQLLLDLQGRADDKAQADRTYAEQVREYNLNRADTLTASKSKVVGPTAPTTAGRLAYYQQQADFRTKHDPNGYVWEGTTSGIHPVTDKRTGKPIVDPAFAAAQAQGLIPKAVKVGNTVGHYDPTGKFVKDYSAPFKPSAPKAPPSLTFKNIVGADGKLHTVGLNPKTGKQQIDVGLAPPGSKAGTTTKPPTDNQVTSMIQKWYQGAVSRSTSVNSKTGSVTSTTTQTQDPISYQQALQKLLAMNVPREKAMSLLNSTWKRGEFGRPWLGAAARQALSKQGLHPTPRYEGINFDPKTKKPTKQVPYLLPAQVTALKKAGLLPPGAWGHSGGVAGPVYVIQAGY